MIGNVYQECKGFGKKNGLTKEQYLNMQTEEFMNRRYEFRYNTQIGEVEYRERCSFYFRFRPLDKRAQNSILPVSYTHLLSSLNLVNLEGVPTVPFLIDKNNKK